jgi:RNA polymerase sigma factor (TIGR02999 family)
VDPTPITALLERLQAGEQAAGDELFRRLQAELRWRAERLMAGARPDHTLQPTALVNEAWLRLAGGNRGGWQGRAHFLAVAARAMRSVLVDHARSHGRRKRGGGGERIELDAAVASYAAKDYDLLAVNEALERLHAIDPDLGRLVELRFFGGLTIPETAAVIGASTATVERNWRTARTWFRIHLGDTAHEA